MAQESITRTFELIATRSLVIPKDPDEECILDLNLDEMIIDAPDEEDQKKTVASLLHTKLLKPEIRISSRLLTEAESIDFREVKITPASGIENTVYQKVCVNIIDDKLINYSYTVTTVKKDNARNIFRIIVWQPLTYDHICEYYIESESGRSISPLRISAAAHENHASADNDETASYDEDNPPQEPKEEQELSAPDKHPEQELNASSEETAADEGQNGPEEQCTETNPELQQQGEADSDEEENRLDLEVKLEEDYPDPALERLITQSDEPELGDLSQLNYLINEQTEPELKVQVPVVQHNRYESETDEIQTENRPDVDEINEHIESVSGSDNNSDTETCSRFESEINDGQVQGSDQNSVAEVSSDNSIEQELPDEDSAEEPESPHCSAEFDSSDYRYPLHGPHGSMDTAAELECFNNIDIRYNRDYDIVPDRDTPVAGTADIHENSSDFAQNLDFLSDLVFAGKTPSLSSVKIPEPAGDNRDRITELDLFLESVADLEPDEGDSLLEELNEIAPGKINISGESVQILKDCAPTEVPDNLRILTRPHPKAADRNSTEQDNK